MEAPLTSLIEGTPLWRGGILSPGCRMRFGHHFCFDILLGLMYFYYTLLHHGDFIFLVKSDIQVR